MKEQIIKRLIELYKQLLARYIKINMEQTINSRIIYEEALKAYKAKEHLTLDPSVPAELGCAQAQSVILKRADIDVPKYGYSGTRELYYFCKNSRLFIEMYNPLAGDVSICVSGTSSIGTLHGHVGTWGENHVMSNNSLNGIWEAFYSHQDWHDHFEKELGFITHYFRAI